LYDVTMANGPGTRADLYLYDYGEFIPQLPDAGKTVYSEYITPLSMEFSVGEYSLVLSNSFGMITSSVMRVRAVKAPEVFPAFETKISNLTSNLLLFAQFKTSPSVGGSDGQSIRWLKDGLPVGSRGIADHNILRIDNLQSNDEGIYTMEVSNASGKAVYTCVLKLLPAGESAPVSYPLKVPVITNTITNIVLLAGEPLVLVPSLLDMTEVKWQWFFKGDLLPGVTSSSLRLDHTSTLDSGNYSVTASNALGVSTAVIASVQVNPAPVSFTKTPPANVTLSVGSSFDIDFGLRGNPDTFYWFYNNQYVPWMTNYIWHFDSLQLTNSGSYFCLIPAPGGAIYSSIVNLTVGSGFPPTQHVPTIVVEQATNTLAVGSTKTLQAVITGDAPLSLQWFFNGDALTGSTGNTLVLTNLQVTNSGRYSLSAVNGAGSATSFVARLDVGYPPNFPIAFPNLLLIEGDSLDLRLIGPDVNTNLSTFSKDFENPRSGLGFQTDSIQRSDAGIYQVYSSNPYGTVTNTFSVFVCPRPGPVHAWGDNTFDQATVPDGLRAVAVAGGNNHSLALHRDGTAESWGVVTDSAFLAGHSNIVQISAEDDYTALLMADGTAAFWNEYSRVGFVTKMEDVRLAYMHVTMNGVVGITQLGGVVAFSNNVLITIIPDGSKLYRIGSSANLNYAFSLTGFTFFSVDGSRAPVVIGNNTYQDPPVDSAQGPLHSLELHRSGKVYAYGDNHFGQLSVPQNLENVLTVEAGLLHSYALQKNGVVRGWGDDTWGQISDIPTNVLFSAMASGGYHGLGIEGEFKLYIKKVGNNLILDWPFDQTLESSTSVLGPFHQAFNNGSPSTQAIGNGELYFRLRKYP
ncbi:MAG: hypothetical protein JWM04_1921, partial [Verrucomicrobiales bacterium]|nr:hypothetical protein [Verrucomicrobiales bacterium]